MNPIAQEYYAKSVGVVRLTWEDVEHDTLKIIDRMKQDGFEPDIIVSIARSGLIPASLIAYALGNKQLYVIKVDFSKVQKSGQDQEFERVDGGGERRGDPEPHFRAAAPAVVAACGAAPVDEDVAEQQQAHA